MNSLWVISVDLTFLCLGKIEGWDTGWHSMHKMILGERSESLGINQRKCFVLKFFLVAMVSCCDPYTMLQLGLLPQLTQMATHCHIWRVSVCLSIKADFYRLHTKCKSFRIRMLVSKINCFPLCCWTHKSLEIIGEVGGHPSVLFDFILSCTIKGVTK